MANEIDDILTLLALTILADKKVVEQEIDTFLRIAPEITKGLGLKKPMSQSKLMAWLYTNQAQIKPMLASPEFAKILIGLFTRTQNIPNKQAILNKMTEIAAADNEVHVSEKALIVLAAHHWNVSVPRFVA